MRPSRLKLLEEPHAIVYVQNGAEKRCGTCKHMDLYRHANNKAMSTPRYCKLKPVKNKCGYKCVLEDKHVCDLWEPKG